MQEMHLASLAQLQELRRMSAMDDAASTPGSQGRAVTWAASCHLAGAAGKDGATGGPRNQRDAGTAENGHSKESPGDTHTTSAKVWIDTQDGTHSHGEGGGSSSGNTQDTPCNDNIAAEFLEPAELSSSGNAMSASWGCAAAEEATAKSEAGVASATLHKREDGGAAPVATTSDKGGHVTAAEGIHCEEKLPEKQLGTSLTHGRDCEPGSLISSGNVPPGQLSGFSQEQRMGSPRKDSRSCSDNDATRLRLTEVFASSSCNVAPPLGNARRVKLHDARMRLRC
jgi:hypothetical protein